MNPFLLGASLEPPKPKLIEYVTVKKIEPIEIKEEVNDPNHCEPAMYWASEAPYYCIPKQVVQSTALGLSPVRTAPVRSGSAPSGWYLKGQCTHLVWTMRSVPGWHDAITWPSSARASGWYVGPVPVAGAIGQRGNHVVYVLEVRATTVLIKEANYDNAGSIRTIERPISYFTYIY